MKVEKTLGYYLGWLSIPLISFIIAVYTFKWANIGLNTPGAEGYGGILVWIGGFLIIFGTIYFGWMGTATSRAEEHVREVFETCPFCGSKNVKLVVSAGTSDTVECLDCNAKWLVKYTASGSIQSIKLISPSQGGRGKDLLGTEKSSDFWIELKKNITTSSSGEKETIAPHGDIKEKLKKLQELYRDGLITEEEYRSEKEKLLKEL